MHAGIINKELKDQIMKFISKYRVSHRMDYNGRYYFLTLPVDENTTSKRKEFNKLVNNIKKEFLKQNLISRQIKIIRRYGEHDEDCNFPYDETVLLYDATEVKNGKYSFYSRIDEVLIDHINH